MSQDFYESPAWLELRYRVLKKAGGSCKLCGCRATPDNPLQVDHIKPRSLYPKLEFVESNLQVLCKNCNHGKSNKDDTDWRWQASQELLGKLNRKTSILAHAEPVQRAKLEQLSWLAKNDAGLQKEAARQYEALWNQIEADWIARGEPE